MNENGRLSNAELLRRNAKPPLNRERAPRRLLPNAGSCANGDAAPLFTLPLTRNPSAARWARSVAPSSAAGVPSLGGFVAAAVDAFKSVR